MARKIKAPVTLRITEAEVVDSQLEPADTSAVERSFDDGGEGGGTKCESKYCEKNYSAAPDELELM